MKQQLIDLYKHICEAVTHQSTPAPMLDKAPAHQDFLYHGKIGRKQDQDGYYLYFDSRLQQSMQPWHVLF